MRSTAADGSHWEYLGNSFIQGGFAWNTSERQLEVVSRARFFIGIVGNNKKTIVDGRGDIAVNDKRDGKRYRRFSLE